MTRAIALICAAITACGVLAIVVAAPAREPRPQATVVVDLRHGPTLFSIPDAKNVSSMTAECYNNVFPDTGVVEVPRKHFDVIIKKLRELEIDKNPEISGSETGTLQIRFDEKESLRICWYYYGVRNGGRLSCNGIPVRVKGSDEYGGSNGVDTMIRAIADELKRDKPAQR